MGMARATNLHAVATLKPVSGMWENCELYQYPGDSEYEEHVLLSQKAVDCTSGTPPSAAEWHKGRAFRMPLSACGPYRAMSGLR